MASEVYMARESKISSGVENGIKKSGGTFMQRLARRAVLNELSIVSSRYTDPSMVSVEITPKGNHRIWYGDYDTGLTVGKAGGRTTSQLRRYGLIKKI